MKALPLPHLSRQSTSSCGPRACQRLAQRPCEDDLKSGGPRAEFKCVCVCVCGAKAPGECERCEKVQCASRRVSCGSAHSERRSEQTERCG